MTLKVVGGLEEDSPVIKTYCGNNETKAGVTSYGPMSVRFKTDQNVVGTGFKAEIKGNTILYILCCEFKANIT